MVYVYKTRYMYAPVDIENVEIKEERFDSTEINWTEWISAISACLCMYIFFYMYALAHIRSV